jgi:hypothetical protein
MVMMTWLQKIIEAQRALLRGRLESPMAELAVRCTASWRDRNRLNQILGEALAHLPACQQIYAIDTNGIQVSSSVGRHAVDHGQYGQSPAHRPYLLSAAPGKSFFLSAVYLRPAERRSGITAVQTVTDGLSVLGFVAADLFLRNLTQLERRAGPAPARWRQIKGDPVIRDALFQRPQARSALDERVDDVIAIMSELIGERGVFHAMLDFSTAYATLRLTEDPYRDRMHVLEEIIDPSICLAYPNRPYAEQAVVPPDLVRPVFEQFKRLRNVDEYIYLRSGSLNVINGMVELTFSCDGSHYIPVHQFLHKSDGFWFGVPSGDGGLEEIGVPSANPGVF